MRLEEREGHGFAKEASSEEMEGKFLTFYVDGQLYGMPIADVVQIIGMRNITQIPESSEYLKGIIQMRDGVIPVIDIRIRFGREERAYSERTCIIVSTIQDTTIGFIVDEVDAVRNIDDGLISPPPRTAGGETAYLTGIARLEDQTALILDCAEIVPKEELARL